MNKVYVGMSGGVDSSVCAYVLQKKGYDVTGVTLSMWENTESSDAKRVCEQLGIKHITLDFKDEFSNKVIDYFINEYKNCRTPNPCIACNKNLKWKGLLSYADKSKGMIATGHYSSVEKTKTGRLAIKRPADFSKDQTYVLYTLSQEQLERTLFPLSEYTKEDVRKMAKDIELFVSDKKDSQDICFIPDGDYARYIREHANIDSLPGEFTDKNGNVLGEHKGLINYTIGQRKNLGIALGKRAYVLSLDPQKNRVILGKNEDLFTDTLIANEINHMSEEAFDSGKEYIARIRYSHKGTPCMVSYEGDDVIRVKFKESVRAVTPGQAVVIYDGDLVAGGGTIIA